MSPLCFCTEATVLLQYAGVIEQKMSLLCASPKMITSPIQDGSLEKHAALRKKVESARKLQGR